MIRINLLPQEFRHKEAKQFKLPPFVSPKGLLIFLAFLAVVEVSTMVNLKFFAGKKFDSLQNEYRNLGPDLKSVRDVKAQASLAQEVNRQLEAWMKPTFTWTAFMNGLSNGMEKGVWLTHLSFERRDFDLAPKPDPAGTVRPPRPGGGDKEKRVVMIIRGRVAVDQEEAAVAGRFIENLKNQKAISDLTEDLRLDEIRRTPDSKVAMFDFVILGTVKREHEKDFFNLP